MICFMICTKRKDGSMISGADRRYQELLFGLSQRHKVILCAEEREEFVNNKNIKLIRINTKKIRRMPYNLSHVIHIIQKRKIIRKCHADVAVAWGPVQVILFRLCGMRHIVSCNREDLIGYKKLQCSKKSDYFKLLAWLIVEQFELLFSDKIIVQCQADREALLKRHPILYRILKVPVVIQVNNINVSWCKKGSFEYTGDKDEITIAFISSFADGSGYAKSRKGNDIFLPAACRLIDNGFKIRVLVAGGGPYLDLYIRQYRKYPSIQFLGFCDTNEVFNKSQFAIVPSLLDSCPNALLEAMAYGLPVYGANVGGIRDILRNSNFLFLPDKNEVYKFVRNKLINKQFADDKKEQLKIKEELIFDWCKAMENHIESTFK